MLVKKGFTVNIESGAGIEARFRNDDYAEAGGKLTDKKSVYNSGKTITISCSWCCVLTNYCWKFADIVLKVRQPLDTEVANFKEHGHVISFLYPALNKPLIEKMAERKRTAFGLFIFFFI